MNLRDYLQKTDQQKIALGHFNVSTIEVFNSIVKISAKLDLPVIIGVSQGEANFFGIENISQLVKFYQQKNLKIFLNADHFRDLEMVKQAALNNFDSILFDAGELDLTGNIKKTQEAVKIIKEINKEILIEGELGYLGAGSIIRDEIPKGAVIEESQMIRPEEAQKFVSDTGVDLIGPAVGNIHGIVKGYKENLNFQRIKELKEATKKYLVLHGASSIEDEKILKAIDSGINIIHINTDLRIAWRKNLEESFREMPQEIAPYKLLEKSQFEIEKILENKIKLFAKI